MLIEDAKVNACLLPLKALSSGSSRPGWVKAADTQTWNQKVSGSNLGPSTVWCPILIMGHHESAWMMTSQYDS